MRRCVPPPFSPAVCCILRCSVFELCVAVCCSALQCVAVCCSVLQSAEVCCNVLQCVVFHIAVPLHSVLQCVAVPSALHQIKKGDKRRGGVSSHSRTRYPCCRRSHMLSRPARTTQPARSCAIAVSGHVTRVPTPLRVSRLKHHIHVKRDPCHQ